MRTPPTTGYTTRTEVTSDYTQRIVPISDYDRPRFFSSVELCDSEGIFLTDVIGEQLIVTGDPTFTKIIQTPYT